MNMKKLFSALMALVALNACTFLPEPPYKLPITDGNSSNLEEGVYINETFASTFGVFSTVETVGNYPWKISYSSATATSYDNATQKNSEATSWLISDPIDFTDETEAHISFDYIIRYSESGKVAANHQLLISSEYNGDATVDGIWKDIPYNAVEGADWDTWYKADVAIPTEFMGKNNIVVALRYTAKTKSGTWEVKNFKLEKGVPSGDNGGSNEVIEAVEYTIEQAQQAFANGTTGYATIKGYIVGAIDGSIENCKFSETTTVKTNVLIAASANEKDYNKCISVQLSGEILDKVNLKDNPGNYRREITVTGELASYLGIAGIKNTREYKLGELSTEPLPTPEKPVIPEGENIISNGSFEVWAENKPADWRTIEEYNKSPEIEQSTEYFDGTSSIVVKGSTSNKMLHSKNYKLMPGTYTMYVFVKSNGDEKGFCRFGYNKISSNGNPGVQPKYGDEATEVTDEWTRREYQFTFEQEQEIALVIMNHSNGKGASFLLDNVMLIKEDGEDVTE